MCFAGQCKECSAPFHSKGKTTIRFRTPFGDVPIASPRLHRCACDTASTRTFSPLTGLFREHVAPEMLYLETKTPHFLVLSSRIGLQVYYPRADFFANTSASDKTARSPM